MGWPGAISFLPSWGLQLGGGRGGLPFLTSCCPGLSPFSSTSGQGLPPGPAGTGIWE